MDMLPIVRLSFTSTVWTIISTRIVYLPILHTSFNHTMLVVLATVPNSRVGSDMEPNCGNGSYHTKTWTIAIGPVLPSKTQQYNIPSLAAIKYLSSNRIVT
jgi:hypothetical protein